jgi:hypothetical protein
MVVRADRTGRWCSRITSSPLCLYPAVSLRVHRTPCQEQAASLLTSGPWGWGLSFLSQSIRVEEIGLRVMQRRLMRRTAGPRFPPSYQGRGERPSVPWICHLAPYAVPRECSAYSARRQRTLDRRDVMWRVGVDAQGQPRRGADISDVVTWRLTPRVSTRGSGISSRTHSRMHPAARTGACVVYARGTTPTGRGWSVIHPFEPNRGRSRHDRRTRRRHTRRMGICSL